jgi:hypothetical protein
VGGFVDGIGFGLMVVGVVIFAIGLAVRSNYVRNVLNPDALSLWFRGEGLILRQLCLQSLLGSRWRASR